MSVYVKLSTTLRDFVPDYRPEDGLHADISSLGPEATAGDLATLLGLPHSEIKIVMLNGRQNKLDCRISDGDRVAYFPAVGGG